MDFLKHLNTTKIQYTCRGIGIYHLFFKGYENERNNNKQHKLFHSFIHNDIHNILSRNSLPIKKKNSFHIFFLPTANN